MLKKILAVLTIIAVPALSQATIAPTWEDYNNFDDVFLAKGGTSSYSYQHDITDNGFDLGLDTAIGGKLIVNVADDNDFWLEALIFDFDVWGTGFDFVNLNYEIAILGGSALLEITETGMLDVTILAAKGDFWLKSSTLKVWGDEGATSASVPEPGTLVLLSFSLLGLAGIRRFKKSA